MDLKTYKAKSAALYADIEQLVAQHGFKLGNVSAGVDKIAGTVRLKLELIDANLKDASGNATTPEQERWKLMASLYDLDPEWLGRKMVIRNRHYTIAGMRDTSGSKPVLVKRDDGKSFVLDASTVKLQMRVPA